MMDVMGNRGPKGRRGKACGSRGEEMQDTSSSVILLLP
jgi:hypothetical protein